MTQSTTFCVLPFIGMNVHIDGGLSPCCYQSHDDVTHTFDQYPEWRAKGLHDLKTNLVQGVKDPRCKRCWDLESNGLKSYRQQWNDAYGDHPCHAADANTVDIHHDLAFLHLDFDNFCNLRCIMCHPTVSSSIEAEYKQNQLIYEPFVGHPKLAKQPWHATNQWEHLLDHLDKVDNLILTGGEPLINPTVIRLLRKLDLAKANLIVTTNASQIRQEVYDLLAAAKSCQITVSLEGIGRHNDYLRYGSDWSTMEHNIKWLSQLPNYRWLSMNINHVLQRTSQWSLVPLIQWCMDHNYNFNINTLSFPHYLKLEGMPDQDKEALIRDLEHLRPVIARTYSNSQESQWIDNALAELHKSKYDPEIERRFYQYVHMLDSVRGTDFAKTFKNGTVTHV